MKTYLIIASLLFIIASAITIAIFVYLNKNFELPPVTL
jgi:hypothetical protein